MVVRDAYRRILPHYTVVNSILTAEHHSYHDAQRLLSGCRAARQVWVETLPGLQEYFAALTPAERRAYGLAARERVLAVPARLRDGRELILPVRELKGREMPQSRFTSVDVLARTAALTALLR